MSSTSTAEEAPPSLWQYVTIADYDPPSHPVTHTVKKGVSFLKPLFRRDEAEQDTLLKAEEDLQALPAWQLERLVPAPRWDAAAEALQPILVDWLAQEQPDRPIVTLIGPPYSGHADILAAWAEQQNWSLLSPPTPAQILAGDDAWLSELSRADAPWVLPALEKVYLRHAVGLSLVRRFLDRAYSGDFGRGVIGCDSWAWSFLQHIWHGRWSVPLTLQAFDQEKLAYYFQSIAQLVNKEPLHFRQSNDGSYVLPPPDDDEASVETSKFLHHLAASSRGILGVAWAYWQDSLKARPDEMMAEEAQIEQGKIPQETIWVNPWDDLERPSLPPGAGRDEAFILHALLLHNGLSFELLPQLLPLSPSQVAETLFRLKDAGLVVRRHELLRVSPRGYPAVRQFLNSSGYLLDQF
jgi:hypothetical protein